MKKLLHNYKLMILFILANSVASSLLAMSLDLTQLPTAANREGIDGKALEASLYEIVDVSLTDASGRTALMDALHKRASIQVVRQLLNRGANPNIQDNEGRTALMEAARFSVEAVRELLNKDADPNIESKDGFTALMWAVLYAKMHGERDIVKELLARGANPNTRAQDGFNILTRIEGHDTETASLLRAHGAESSLLDRVHYKVYNLAHDVHHAALRLLERPTDRQRLFTTN
jgi:ankyrin repeat protein